MAVVKIEKKVLIKFITDLLGVKRAKDAMKDLDGSMKSTQKTTKSLSGRMADLAKRAILVAPIWMAIRGAINLARKAVMDIIGAFLELDKGMRKVMAVAQDTGMGTAKIYSELATRARSYFVTTSRSMKEVTEAMYQLGTAGRSTQEIMEGFEHVMNLAVGTFGDVATAGKVVSGILNVFEKDLKKLGGTSRQIQYVTDLLSTAWRNNQIELSEIGQSMQYLASVGSALDIKLEDLIATSAVMNDAMLRGGKGARMLAQSFVKIAKDSGKLRDLGVFFDPNKPLKFREVMGQLSEIYKEQKGSLSFVKDITEIFGIRGQRAVMAVLTQWEKWNKETQRTPGEINGTARELKDLAEGSWGGILKRTWREIWATGPETGTSKAKEAFVNGIIEPAQRARDEIKELQEIFDTFGKSISLTADQADKLISHLGGGGKAAKLVSTIMDIYNPKRMFEQGGKPGVGIGATLRGDVTGEGKRIAKELTDAWITGAKAVEIYRKTVERLRPGVTPTGKPVLKTDQQKALEGLQERIKAGKEITDFSQKEIDLTAKRFGIVEEEAKVKKEWFKDYYNYLQKLDLEKKLGAELTMQQKIQLETLLQESKYRDMRIKGDKEGIILSKQLEDMVDIYNKKVLNTKKVKEIANKKTGEEKKFLLDINDIWDKKNNKLALNNENIFKYAQKIKGVGSAWEFVVAIINKALSAQSQLDKESGKLTEKQRAQLGFERELTLFKAGGLYDTQELLAIEIQLNDKYEDRQNAVQKIMENHRLETKILEDQLKIIDEFSDKLEDTWSDALGDMLKGDISDFFDRISEQWRNVFIENIAGGLTDKLFDVTGMGEQFGSMMLGVQNMFKSPAARGADIIGQSLISSSSVGARMYYNAIVSASGAGIGAGGGAVGVGAGGAGFGMGAGGLLGLFSGQGTFKPPRNDEEYLRMMQGEFKEKTKGDELLKKLGGILNFGLGVYGAYESAGGGGLGAGAGLAMGAGMLIGGPAGMALMLTSAILSSFNKETSTAIQENELGISSKINHSNDILEIINRNIVGLREKFEPYPMPSSFYFSQKPGGGVQNQVSINVNVGSEAQGNEVVKAIQDNFNISAQRVLQP